MFIIKKVSLKPILAALALVFLLSAPASSVSAVETIDVSLDSARCFEEGLYKFQSVQVSVGPERMDYRGGDTIKFIGNVINENAYPVVDGNIYVRIAKKNPDYITEGHYAIDEFIAIENVVIDASSETPVEFEWKVPPQLGAGDYRADYFFSVGKRFNLGGLPFTNEIVVGFSSFKIKSTKQTEFILDRAGTKVNGVAYKHIGNWPRTEQQQQVEITQALKNLSNDELDVDVTYNLYSWDSLDEKDFISTKTEKVVVPAKSSIDLNYTIESVGEAVYYLNILASSGGNSSIVNIRIISDISKSRINYPAITKFPLTEGDDFKIFSCFHTTSGVEEDAKMILSLSDKDGEEVARGEWSGTFNSAMSAVSGDITALKDYRFLNLKAKLFDKEGELIEQYETDYDCATLNSESCIVAEENYAKEIVLISAIIAILIAFVLMSVSKKLADNGKPQKGLIMTAVIICLIGILAILVSISGGLDRVGAVVSVSNNGRTKTKTVEVGYIVGMNDRVGYTGSISRTMAVGHNISNPDSLPKNAKIPFYADVQCEYHRNGGAWDTPYCGEVSNFGEDSGSRHGKIKWSDPEYTAMAISSNTGVIKCSGLECKAVGPGTATVTIEIPKVTSSFEACFQRQDGIIVAGTNTLGCEKWNNNASGEIKDRVTLGKKEAGSFVGFGTTPNSYIRSINLEGFKPTWEFTVVTDTNEDTTIPTSASCGSANGGKFTYAEILEQRDAGNFCGMGSVHRPIPVDVDNGIVYAESTMHWLCVTKERAKNDTITWDEINTSGFDKTGTQWCGATIDFAGGNNNSNQKTDLLVSCFVSPTTAKADGKDEIKWNAILSNASTSVPITYEWHGLNEQITKTVTATSSESKIYTGVSVTVKNSGKTASAKCRDAKFTKEKVIPSIVPAIVDSVDDRCVIQWPGDDDATCYLMRKEPGMKSTELKSATSIPVSPGYSYYVECTQTVEGGGTSIIQSDILQCILNPDFIEI